VLFFNAPDQVLIDRCLERGKTSGRSDDNEESLKHRIATYHSKSEPVVEVGFAMRCDAVYRRPHWLSCFSTTGSKVKSLKSTLIETWKTFGLKQRPK
jgi:hypothetical protein